jgi:hypothetical protein
LDAPTAQFWAIATAVPAVLALISYLFWFGRMAQRLRAKHPEVWRGLGSPRLAGLFAVSGGRLVAWVSRQGYLSLRNDESIALGSACRRVYFAMLGVAVWILCAIIVGPSELR